MAAGYHMAAVRLVPGSTMAASMMKPEIQVPDVTMAFRDDDDNNLAYNDDDERTNKR